MGTGGGRVAIFSCLPNVENTEEMILKLLKRIKASKEETTPTTEHSNGGLLSQEVENKKSDERQAALDNGTSDSPIPSHYQRRRKTQFGKTLRNKTVKDRPRELLPDVYRLEYEHCSHVVTASNESVRVMLSVRYVVTLVSLGVLAHKGLTLASVEACKGLTLTSVPG